ncbi:MAG: site-specific DNA-methyltransferase, partial [Parcubacteria group bacterium]|nr:site-specific DNA-methyltransferase [Parcubacteria group bacterium]
CDDIFGRENFVANVVWQKKYTTANDATGIPASHDHILVFQKTELFKRNLLPRGDKQNKLYKNKDKKGLWRSDNLLVKTFSPEYVFPIMNPYTKKEYLPREGSCWRANKKTIAKWLREGRIYFGKDSKGAPQLKRYLNEVQQGVVPGTWWKFEEVGHNDESKKELQRLDLSRCEFTTPKPERLIQRILGIGSNEGDLALDFFAGSATTGAVAMKMKRQFILTEQMDYVEKVTVGRLRKVIGKNKKKSGEMFAGLEYDQGGISEEVNWKGGGEFIYCELMKYNEQFVDKIRQAKSTKELLKIWEEMKAKSFLNYNVDISKFDKTISDFKKLPLAKQKHTLFGLLNKNQLYVNLSEIKDGEFKIKEEDKKVNKEFYGTE